MAMFESNIQKHHISFDYFYAVTNKEIASHFNLLAKVMELHDENQFKIRSYANAYINLKKLDTPLASMTIDQLQELKGVGDAIAEKIQSLVHTGKMPTLEKYLAKTPPGVVEMLKINGLGPKKVATLWKEYGFESPGELLYACNENRLIELKGFGLKSQESIAQAIEFLQSAEGKYLHTKIESQGEVIIKLIQEKYPGSKTEITGEWRRGIQELQKLELLTTCSKAELEMVFSKEDFHWENNLSSNEYTGIWQEYMPTHFYHTNVTAWNKSLYLTSGPQSFINKYHWKEDLNSEKELFKEYKLPYLSPELRDIEDIDKKSVSFIDSLIEEKDIRGTIHNHSTYSDGIHTLKEMADTAKKSGYEYFGITDHSQSSVLAKGLKPDDLQKQWYEIEELNKKYSDFIILKGIECDILGQGDLDYEEDILKKFDLVIASIHIGFQMDIDKATLRMIKAIENPSTNIIGHPTGRLILTREGYPLNFLKIIDACKANQVAIELNANPQRLDIDYPILKHCIKKGVFIAINPDAHNRTALQDIKYGIKAARKGLLPKELCLNTLSAPDLLRFCRKNS